MAFLSVKNATVDRFVYNGKGVRLVETFTKRDGEQGKAYFTAWFQNPVDDFNEGDVVNISGTFSVKSNVYTDKDGIEQIGTDVSINNARYDGPGESSDEAF